MAVATLTAASCATLCKVCIPNTICLYMFGNELIIMLQYTESVSVVSNLASLVYDLISLSMCFNM